MNRDAAALIRVRKELELELAGVQRVADDCGRLAPDLPDWVCRRVRASLLHDFYTGHVFRNVYGFELEDERREPLDRAFPCVCA